MGSSTLANISGTDSHKLYVKYSHDEDIRLAIDLPEGYVLFSLSWLKDLLEALRNKTSLPTAIIIDLNVFSIAQVSPILNKLKDNEYFFKIPIIGLADQDKVFDTSALLAAGLDDCFYSPINWTMIEKRVQFLLEFKELTKVASIPNTIHEYSVPFSKRAFDLIVASIALLALSPLLIMVSILIKLESKGPIFYTSKRIGTGYQEFNFLKFRSMRINADAQLEQLAHLNSYENKSKNTNTFFKIENDPRVTRIGKAIRKTSIDELPQLINVLRGEMSIIGNRPLPLYEAKNIMKDDWARRFLAPAGLTGLWQVDERGKDNLSIEERINLDVSYAERASLLMDLKILIKTMPAMWQRG